ncbi:MAG: hypothetical protein ACI91B_000616 [Planctomycetota bacterium]|jgi:hypothetical protein
MNLARLTPCLLPIAAACLVSAHAAAQDPVDPPPWWGVDDDVTVSLSWNFPATFTGQPLVTPDFQQAPGWYSNPTPWSGTNNFTWLPTLNGHNGVCALVGTGTPLTGELDLFVDNDPHLGWVKMFWFQVDVFEGSSGDIMQEIKEQLSDYGRGAVTEKIKNLGNGWQQLTVSAQLIPQPDDEDIDFTFLENAFGTVAIDNLHVSSKCVKPRPDEEGDALGKVMGGANLTVSTGRQVRGIAITRDNATAAKHYWIAAVGQGASSHEILEVTSLGAQIGAAIALASTTTQAPFGPMDMTVERARSTVGTGLQEYIYALVDLRPTGGQIQIQAIDITAGGIPEQSRSFAINVATPFTVGQRLSMTFDPTGGDILGAPGVGTFWLGGQTTAGNWIALEYTRNIPGLPVGAIGIPTGDTMDIPPNTQGMDYDETLGNFYSFTSEPLVNPSGTTIRCNGVEISGYDGLPTGVRFCGDLGLHVPGTPPGGVAAAMSVYRTAGAQSELRFACVVDTAANQQYYYELAGPFRYGYSRYGTIGMQSGPPFLGGPFDITLDGVPNSLLGMMFLGSGVANIPLSAGIQAESVASLIPTVSTALMPVLQGGRFSVTIQLPNTPALAYSEAFFQFVLLDTTAPGFLGFSQAGKTVLYP